MCSSTFDLHSKGKQNMLCRLHCMQACPCQPMQASTHRGVLPLSDCGLLPATLPSSRWNTLQRHIDIIQLHSGMMMIQYDMIRCVMIAIRACMQLWGRVYRL